MDEISRLLLLMQMSTGSDILLSGGVIRDDIRLDDDKEWQCIVSASLKRQQEFFCGRYFAHLLLGRMGLGDCEIGRDGKGCPQWPDGVVGSISHTRDFCAVSLAESKHFISLGIDLEESSRLKTSLWPRLFVRSEIEQLERIRDSANRMRHAAIMFSAKEAFYKCDYPLNHQPYMFTDAEVALDEASGQLRLCIEKGNHRVEYQGFYVTGMTHVMTVIGQARC